MTRVQALRLRLLLQVVRGLVVRARPLRMARVQVGFRHCFSQVLRGACFSSALRLRWHSTNYRIRDYVRVCVCVCV